MLVFVGITTYGALEYSEVAIVETQQSQTDARRLTHVWFVCGDNYLYLEGGHPDNPWFKDLGKMSTLGMSRDGVQDVFEFKVYNNPESHQKIRSLMRDKYGWRDQWIGLLFDVSHSSLIELKLTGQCQPVP